LLTQTFPRSKVSVSINEEFSTLIAEISNLDASLEWLDLCKLIELASLVESRPSTILNVFGVHITPVAHVSVVLETLPDFVLWFLFGAPVVNFYGSRNMVDFWNFVELTFLVEI